MKNFAAEIKMKCSELTTYILLLLLPLSSFSQDFILITAPLWVSLGTWYDVFQNTCTTVGHTPAPSTC